MTGEEQDNGGRPPGMEEEVTLSSCSATGGEMERELKILEVTSWNGSTICGVPTCRLKCDDNWTFATANMLTYLGFKDRFAKVQICANCKKKAEQFEKNSVEAIQNFGNMFNVQCELPNKVPETVNLDEDDEMTNLLAKASRRNAKEVDFVNALVEGIMSEYRVLEQVEKCKEKCTKEASTMVEEFKELFRDAEELSSKTGDLYITIKYKNNWLFDPNPVHEIETEVADIDANGNVTTTLTGNVIVNTESMKKLPDLLNKLSEQRAAKEAADKDSKSRRLSIIRKPGPASKTRYYEVYHDNNLDSLFHVKPSLPPEVCERKAKALLSKPEIIHRSHPVVGDLVYAMIGNLQNLWVKGEIGEIVKNPIRKEWECIVKYEPVRDKKPTGGVIDDTTKIYVRQLSLKQMAYPVTCHFRLSMGCRVIAIYSNMSEKSGKERCGYFYAGVVAEPLKKSTGYRYLIFFDDGYAQYVYPEYVHLVYENSKNVWNDVHPDAYEFIKGYVTKYPEWPTVKLHVGELVTTEWNGKWSVARVLKIDNSLALVRFETDGKEEWIYRGSTRFRPIFRLLEKQKEVTGQLGVKENRVPSPHPVQRSTTRRVHYYDELQEFTGRALSFLDPLDPDLYIELQGSVSKIKIPKSAPKPKTLVPHTCNSSCVMQFVASEELKRLSPLVVPFFFGWARQVSGEAVSYKAPCGVLLKDCNELAEYLDVTESNLSIDYFCFDRNVDCLNEFVPARSLLKLEDFTNGKERVPVQCVNSVDYDCLPYLEYTSEPIISEGVPLNRNTDFMVCCDCTDNCQDKSKCACWQLTHQGISFSVKDGNSDGGRISKKKRRKAKLIPKAYEHRRLQGYIASGIYECNSKCKCKQTCCNRVVQNGIQWPLQIFKTTQKGWGVRALCDMPAGAFVCTYSGEILTEESAEDDGKEKGDEYLAELDFIEICEQYKSDYESDATDIEAKSNGQDEGKGLEGENKQTDDKSGNARKKSPAKVPNVPVKSKRKLAASKKRGRPEVREEEEKDDTASSSDDDNEETIAAHQPRFDAQAVASRKRLKQGHRELYANGKEIYVIDARDKANIGRYLNHSCNQNLHVQSVFVDTHDLRFPIVSFFTMRSIKAGTELTWDYNYQIGSVPNKVVYCNCMTPRCKGRFL